MSSRKYVFYVGLNDDIFSDKKLHVDCFKEIVSLRHIDDMTGAEFLSKIRKGEKLLEKEIIEKKFNFKYSDFEEDARALYGMEIRARFSGCLHGPYMIRMNDDSTLDAETLEIVLELKHKEGVLQEFLKDAKI